MKRILFLLVLSLVIVACAPDEIPTAAPSNDVAQLEDVSIELYHSPGCSCCLGWVEYAESLQADVTVTELADLGGFKVDHQVPAEAMSCHTALAGGYVIEGHVPGSAITQLLETRPDIVGIALPGMPADSPGMGGDATTWSNQPVLAIGHDGSLTPFDY